MGEFTIVIVLTNILLLYCVFLYNYFWLLTALVLHLWSINGIKTVHRGLCWTAASTFCLFLKTIYSNFSLGHVDFLFSNYSNGYDLWAAFKFHSKPENGKFWFIEFFTRFYIFISLSRHFFHNWIALTSNSKFTCTHFSKLKIQPGIIIFDGECFHQTNEWNERTNDRMRLCLPRVRARAHSCYFLY